MAKALVILSGGQDSVTCLHWALQTIGEVSAIFFNYGQRHIVEKNQAQIICHKNDVDLKIVDLHFFSKMTDSALTSIGKNVNETKDNGLPASFVPNRNALFITLAHAHAQKIGADHIVGGWCETDYSGYPDCRNDFIKGMETVLNFGSKSSITIHAPLMYLTKAQTFQMAESMGIGQEVIEDSHTCYNGVRDVRHDWGYGCGECPACQLRKKGFAEYLSLKS